MADNTKLMKNLKRLRKEHKLTQDEVSVLISKERSSIAKYETGKIVPPLSILASFAKLYNVTVDELCGMSPPSKPVVVKSNSDDNSNSVTFAQLSKQEQLMILKIRMMNNEDKDELLNSINIKISKDDDNSDDGE